MSTLTRQEHQALLDQMRLCADGLEDAPPLQMMGKAMIRSLPLHCYFITARRFERNGKPGPWRLIIQKEEPRKPDDSQEMIPIYDSEREPMPMPELCRWFFEELKLHEQDDEIDLEHD